MDDDNRRRLMRGSALLGLLSGAGGLTLELATGGVAGRPGAAIPSGICALTCLIALFVLPFLKSDQIA
ncbi:MAG: hypothetical protein KDA61_01650 [Planctomycetales bacterium]|nr:hypothetical protein [Planctomycetales bacterium]